MAANTSDQFKKVGASTVTTLAAPGKALGATSITVGSTTNYPTDTGIVIAIRQVDTSGELVAGTYTEWSATVTSGTTLAIVAAPVYGSDQVYAAGSTTQVFMPVSSYAQNELIDGILTEHDQDGTHGAVTAASIVSAGAITGTTITGSSLVNTGDLQLRSTSIETIRSETQFDYIASGGVWSGDAYGSTRNASMTALVCYIGGRRGTISAVTARPFTASRDTYVDILNTAGTFTLVYTEVTNNAASPALAANSIRLAIIVTGASNIASVASINQGQENKVLPIASSIPYQVTDSLGNLICPRDPNRRVLGYRQRLSDFTTALQVATQITGLAVPAIIPEGRKVRISFGAQRASINASTGNWFFGVCDGAVSATTLQQTISSAFVTNGNVTANNSVVVTPSAGLHTYNGEFHVDANTGTLYGGSTAPMFILVELV